VFIAESVKQWPVSVRPSAVRLSRLFSNVTAVTSADATRGWIEKYPRAEKPTGFMGIAGILRRGKPSPDGKRDIFFLILMQF